MIKKHIPIQGFDEAHDLSTQLTLLRSSINDESNAKALDDAVKCARSISISNELSDSQNGVVKEIYMKAIEHPMTTHSTLKAIESWVRQDRAEHYGFMKALLGHEPPQKLWYVGKDIMSAIENRPYFYGGGKKMRRH